jgi:hypothetical protein
MSKFESENARVVRYMPSIAPAGACSTHFTNTGPRLHAANVVVYGVVGESFCCCRRWSRGETLEVQNI